MANLEVVAFAFGSVLAQAGSALLYVYAARLMGPAEFGLAVSAVAVAAWLTTLVDFGNASYVLRELSARRMSFDEAFSRLIGRVVALGALLPIAVTFSLLDRSLIPAILISIAGIRLATLLVSSVLRGLGAAGTVVVLAVIEPVASLVCVLLLSTRQTTMDPQTFLLAVLAGAVIALIVGLRVTLKRHGDPAWNATFAWSDTRTFGVFGLAVGATQLDTPIVARGVSLDVAGEYGAISRWTRPITTLTQSFLFMAVPRIASANSWKDAVRSISTGFWVLALSLLGAMGLAIGAPFLVQTLLGPAYADSVGALRVLALAAVVGVPTQFMATFLINRGLDRPVAAVQVVATFIQLLLVVPLTVVWGTAGTSAAVLISLSLSLAVMSCFALRRLAHRSK